MMRIAYDYLSVLHHLFLNQGQSAKPVYGYIYIPFKKEELSDGVLSGFIRLQEYFASPLNKGKNYVLCFHGEGSLSNLPKDAKVYVMAHGIPLSPSRKWISAIMDPGLPYSQLEHLPYYDWAYSVSGGKKAITVETVAARMKSDGLLESNHVNIKLFFCDAIGKAQILAAKFLKEFDEYQNVFRVDYYPSVLNISVKNEEMTFNKWAKEEGRENVRASLIRQSLFSKHSSNDDCFAKSDEVIEKQVVNISIV